MSSQQAEKDDRSTDSTQIGFGSFDRSTGTSGQLGSASTAQPEGSSALGDSSAAANKRQKRDEGTAIGQSVGGTGEGQIGASQLWNTLSAAP